MSASLDCPEAVTWQELAAVTLSPADQDRFERHLETCVVCRQRLETLGAEDEVLRLARQVGDPTARPADPVLSAVQEQLLETVSPNAAGSPDLYFLRPAGRPGLLGVLGDYEACQVIGQGGMASVLLGFDPGLQRPVAIKVLAPALAGSATARLRFTREAHAAAAVRHDHIVTVHGVHEADGLPYLVMEYLAGGSLQDRLDDDGPLAVEEVVRIGMQTASGLAAAHEKGLIHRDIKPANILLEGERPRVSGPVDGPDRRADAAPLANARVKITDFGLARMSDDAGLTQNGVVAGTPEYMAPEQGRGEGIDHRADLFSLGSVLYALCTGVAPFRGPTALAVLRQVCDEQPRPVRAVNPDVPVWLEALITRLMEKDPARRFQSAAEVASVLERYLAHLRHPATVAAPELSPARARRGRCPRYLLTVLLAGLILGTPWMFAGGPAAEEKPSGEIHVPLRGTPDDRLNWSRFGDNDQKRVLFEPDGMRITLPMKPGKREKVGLVLGTPAKGNFEATVSYHVLKETAGFEANREAVNFYLVAILDRPQWTGAGLTRKMGSDKGARFWTWYSEWDKDGKQQMRGKHFPAQAASGRLRLARNGPTLQFHVADGPDADFILLHETEFSVEDVKEFRIVGSAAGPEAELDVRFTDLRLRTGMEAEPAEPARKTPWSLWVVVGLLGLVTLDGVLVARRRRAAPHPAAPASVSFSCPACGRTIKARAGPPARKVKCPKCGQAVPVPEAGAS